jgi:DNA-binding beta-propeller fold protein YncE
MLKTFARLLVLGMSVVTMTAQAPTMPVFQVDSTWPSLPNNWVLGVVSSVAVDSRDHVWILHRPRTVAENLKGRAAPPVLEFDGDGRFVNAWGGDAQGYDWPATEHGIFIDHKNVVWIGGSGVGDDMLLKFTTQGKFIRQFGARGQSKGNADPKNVNRPADVFVHAKTNEAFVADGYGNRRVIVLDADSGAFKRMWGAFGKAPDGEPPAGAPAARGATDGRGATGARGATDATGARGARGAEGAAGARGAAGAAPAPPLDTEGEGSPRFSNPVHAIKVSNDGLVYVADRQNRRVQVFTTEGKYLTQGFVNRAGPAAGSAAGLGFSPDPQQQFLYVSDLGNSHVAVMNRKTLQVLYQFGTRGAAPGDFQAPHLLAVDSKGNLYTAEVNPGNRAQKFVFKGMSATPPANALTQR